MHTNVHSLSLAKYNSLQGDWEYSPSPEVDLSELNESQVMAANESVTEHLRQLDALIDQLKQDADVRMFRNRFMRWKERTKSALESTVSAKEATQFARLPTRIYVGTTLDDIISVHRDSLRSLLEELTNHPESVLSAKLDPSDDPKPIESRQRVIISHSALDRHLAEYVADVIEKCCPGTETFQSSRPGDIRPAAD